MYVMREVWNLSFRYTTHVTIGFDFFLLLWRAWYLRNDITHQEDKASINAPVRFLLAYLRVSILSQTQRGNVSS
jgi:hypothetical protein